MRTLRQLLPLNCLLTPNCHPERRFLPRRTCATGGECIGPPLRFAQDQDDNGRGCRQLGTAFFSSHKVSAVARSTVFFLVRATATPCPIRHPSGWQNCSTLPSGLAERRGAGGRVAAVDKGGCGGLGKSLSSRGPCIRV